MKPIYVVTISEVMNAYADEIDVEAFANNDDAVSWIEKQIAEKKETYNLDESAIDDWYVEIDGPSHTVQYDVKECLLK